MIALDGQLDLLAVKGRINNAYMDFKGDDLAFYAALGDVKALLAEVERLREEAAKGARVSGSGSGSGSSPTP